MFLSTDVTGSYTVSMTARAGAYDGPIVGTASATVTLNGASTVPTPVDFNFAPAAVTPGTLLTFAMTQVTPVPDGLPDLLYHIGTCGLGDANCATPSPLKETTDTAPPLDTFRRNGPSAVIFDTRPLPPPVILLIDGFLN